MVKMGYSTVQNDDLSQEYPKISDGRLTFRLSRLWQYGMSYICITCNTSKRLNMNPTVGLNTIPTLDPELAAE
jgi:hypothetical protein